MSAQLQPEMYFISPRPLAGHCKYRLETTGDTLLSTVYVKSAMNTQVSDDIHTFSIVG